MLLNPSYLRTRIRKILSQLPYLSKALSLLWTAARRWTIGWIALLIVQGLLPVAIVYLTKFLVDSLVVTLNSDRTSADVRRVLVFAVLMAVVVIVGEVLRTATSWIRTAQSELLKDHISGLIHEKSVAADLAFYEWPEYYDHLHRAREEANYRPIALVDTVGSLLQNSITIIAMGAVLIRFGVWLPAALLVSALPAFYIILRYTMLQHEWRRRAAADERRTWYYDQVLTSGQNAPEVRLFGLGDYFRSAFRKLRARLRGERLKLARDQSLAELGAGGIALAISGGALLLMVWRTMQGFFTLGDLALFYQAFNQGQRLVRTLLENVGQLYANSLFLGNLFEFLALKPQIIDPAEASDAPRSLKTEIRFDGVTFHYPGSERPALQDFSLTIPAGQIAAIVGQNGAGKSTLIKLLCRFYDPQSGRIALDGIDLREFRVEELHRLFTVLFQEPVRYAATVADNIRFGDVNSTAKKFEIKNAAHSAGADEMIERLPHNYETLLGKWFADGSELSVGEWQRIALSRAYLRQASIVVLDEPTSAMDPWAEADWLERLRQLVAGQTAIIITHRLTTAMYADVIHVMDGGRIIESGDHHQLIALGGRYAQSWEGQMRGLERSVAV
jgi:ATP-binding cassette, subfamily B, bacterial